MSNYPDGVTAGSRALNVDIHKDSEIFCEQCNSEQPHTVSVDGVIETATCDTCGAETETDVSEPDPDEAHDRAREGW